MLLNKSCWPLEVLYDFESYFVYEYDLARLCLACSATDIFSSVGNIYNWTKELYIELHTTNDIILLINMIVIVSFFNANSSGKIISIYVSIYNSKNITVIEISVKCFIFVKKNAWGVFKGFTWLSLMSSFKAFYHIQWSSN